MSELNDAYKIRKANDKEFADKFKILEKAMELSRGKANTQDFLPLLNSKNITAEIIAEIANGFNDEDKDKDLSPSGYRIWSESYGRLNVKKWGTDPDNPSPVVTMKTKWKDNNANGYWFRDTFIYRAMKNLGLNTKELEREMDSTTNYSTKGCIAKNVYNVGDRVSYPFTVSSGFTNRIRTYSSISTCSQVQDVKNVLNMYYQASPDLRKRILEDEKINRLFSTKAVVEKKKSYCPDNIESNIDNDEWRKFQIENMVQEFDWLVHAPKDAKEVIYDDIERYIERGRYWDYPLLTILCNKTFRYPHSDKNVEIVREAYAVMDYMGIGVAYNGNPDRAYKDARDVDGAGVGKMLKKVSSMMRRFRSDIKKGYPVEDVREVVVDDLNIWVNTKVNGNWVFFALEGVDKDYSSIAPKPKKNCTKVSTGDIPTLSNRNFASDDEFGEVVTLNDEEDKNE